MNSSPSQSEQEAAIAVLIKAAHIAQSKGAFNLEEASVIYKACNRFTSNSDIKSEKQEVAVNNFNE